MRLQVSTSSPPESWPRRAWAWWPTPSSRAAPFATTKVDGTDNVYIFR